MAANPVSAEPSGALKMARERMESADFRATGHLVRVDAGGKRTSYGIALKAHWFAGVLRIESDITSPEAAREHVLLQMRPGGQSTIEMARPGDKAARELPVEAWGNGPLGEAFSYEDLLDAHLFWANQSLVEQTKYGVRDCDLIRSTPGGADHSGYIEVRSWLDRTIGYPVHEEKTLRKSGTVKEFTYLGLRQNEGVWSANQVEAKVRGQAGSTLLVIEHGSPHAHLTLKDFRPEQLPVF